MIGAATQLGYSAVDRTMLKRHLDLAGRHVHDGQEHIARQREIVAQLERRHRDSTTLKIAPTHPEIRAAPAVRATLLLLATAVSPDEDLHA
jgi:hypothetical protein